MINFECSFDLACFKSERKCSLHVFGGLPPLGEFLPAWQRTWNQMNHLSLNSVKDSMGFISYQF